MPDRPTPEALRRVPLLSALTDAELAALAAAAVLQEVEAQQPLFREGDPGDGLLLLLSGSTEVVKRDPTGKHQILAVLSAPAVLGEMAVLEPGGKRTASALAVTPVELAFLSGAELRARVAGGEPAALKLAAGIARVLARRLNDVNARLVQLLTAAPHIEQLAEFQRALERWGTDG
jgi:CRP/FNR family transcriptional regulator, cyclic AMP receptor protein